MVSKELQGKILFPWDGSPLSEQALSLATFLARLLGMELVTFRVLLSPRAELVTAPDLLEKDWSEAAYKEAEKEAAQLCISCGEGGIKANRELVVVDAAKEAVANLREEPQDIVAAQILGRAAKPDIGLIVLGSHGAHADKRLPRGGVAMRVINGSSKPVVVVPLPPPT